jgi:hypothetical protein
VTKESVLQPYGFKGREVHSIPLVPAIADVLYPRQRVMLITPPPGKASLAVFVFRMFQNENKHKSIAQ